MKKDLVSIIIPTYNREKIVDEAISCALQQTYENIEVIVVDNHSTDRTYEMLIEKYKENDKIKIYQNEENIGPVRNWEKCLQYANGEYCKILWSDDLMTHDFVEKAITVLKNELDVAFVYSKVSGAQVGATRNYGMTSYALGRTGKYKVETFMEKMSLQSRGLVPVSPGCALFRMKDIKIVSEIPNDFGIDYLRTGAGPDVLIYLFAMIGYENIYYIDEVLNFFRTHSGSISCSEENLYYSYLTAKLYFVNKIEPSVKYRKLLLDDLIAYCIGEGKNCSATYSVVKKCDKRMLLPRFVFKYHKALCEYIRR